MFKPFLASTLLLLSFQASADVVLCEFFDEKGNRLSATSLYQIDDKYIKYSFKSNSGEYDWERKYKVTAVVDDSLYYGPDKTIHGKAGQGNNHHYIKIRLPKGLPTALVQTVNINKNGIDSVSDSRDTDELRCKPL